MKSYANQHRRELTFSAHEWVYVCLQPYRQHFVRLHHHSKLESRYFGHFQVIKKIGTMAYKLDLSETAHVHPMFHVSLSRKCIGVPSERVTPLHLVDTPTN